MIVASIDIGSTWTKGATFDIAPQGDDVRVVKRSSRPTTVGNLFDGFFLVLQEITGCDDPLPLLRSGELKLQYSSSAKGGLAVATIGLVPEVTLELGKIAAQSAGARVSQVFSYHLNELDIAALEKQQPDILLFAGGTDGGNSQYVLANAEKVAQSALNCEIVYAGNRSVAEQVRSILAHKRLRVVDNLLPQFNEPSPEPAQDEIRKVFLDAIVKGKGLDLIVEATGAMPLPTPYVVLEYVRAIHEHVPGWNEFIMFDMGGATTDVYSACQEKPEAGVVVRNIYEPEIKRSVEGDLGMRVSAHATAREGGAPIEIALKRMDVSSDALASYADRLAETPEYLPERPEEQAMDEVLAGACVGYAAARHAGRWTTMYTVEGEVKVQTGRDLTKVGKVVGSGGWLSRQTGFNPAAWMADHGIDRRGRAVLVPRRFDYYRDEQYLFPLLANLAREYPRAAACSGISMLVQ